MNMGMDWQRAAARWIAIAGAAVLAGCAIRGEPAPRAVAVPAAWSAPAEGTAVPDADWWRAFCSSELDALVDRAWRQSLDLAAAVARVRQAQAHARIAGAPLWPALTGTADVRRDGRLGGNASADGNAYSGGFAARYEVDLWGRYGALREAALQDLRASRFDRDTVRLTVTSAVATAWLQALALRERIGIGERNLESAGRVLRLVEARGRAGAALQLELAQQRTLVAAQRRALAALRQQERDARMAIAVLLGEPAPVVPSQEDGLAALRAPSVAPDTPSALLARRPDIAAAEARLAAADANVDAARAALYPSVSLGVFLGGSGARVGTLFDGPLYTLAAGLVAPIFDGGRLGGNHDLTLAQREALLAEYRAAIVSAFADAESAQSAVSGTDAQAGAQAEELAQASRAMTLSEARYRAGADTLLTLLDSQRAFYAAQDLAVQLRQQRLQARVSLYRALGGGWSAHDPL